MLPTLSATLIETEIILNGFTPLFSSDSRLDVDEEQFVYHEKREKKDHVFKSPPIRFPCNNWSRGDLIYLEVQQTL